MAKIAVFRFRDQLILVCVLLFATTCTPISSVRDDGQSEAAPDKSNNSTSMQMMDASAGDDGNHTQVGRTAVAAATACSSPNARSCGVTSASEVLVCRDGTWQADEPCTAGESCVDSAGTVGCRAALPECVNHDSGFVYCDADAKRLVCIDAMHSKELPCEMLERCAMVDDQPKCRCIPGAVLQQQGCVLATRCDVQNGGCDMQTECTPLANGRKCGVCPPGYVGDGEHGCEPQLLRLQISCAQAELPLATGVYNYHAQVPFVCQQLQIQGSAPEGTRVKVFGDELPAVWSWSLPLVKAGETVLPIQVTSESGVTSKYMLSVERAGGQQAYLKASNADSDDLFGFGLAASEDQLFVGAPREDSGSVSDPTSNAAQDSGAAYVFAQQGADWKQLAYLKADPVVSGEELGASIAVAGDTLFVGAPNRDPIYWYGATAPATRIGAVYVFARANGAWKQSARLTPSSGALGDLFGYKLALRGDTLLVGAPGDSSGATQAGAVYVFQRSGDTWTEAQKLTANDPVADGKFGMAVALDADRILVGAPTDGTEATRAGSAYTFVRESGKWRQEQRLVPSTSTTEMTFGWQVTIEGDLLIVAAPGVVQVGPPGEVFTFERAGGSWTQAKPLQAKFPNAADLFGGGLARLGSMLIVGANGDSSGARGIDGDASRTDAYQAGAAYLYVTSNNGHDWVPSTYLKASYPDADDTFGVNVAGNASAIFIAAPYEGSSSRMINGDENNNNASRSGAVYVFR